MTPAETVLANSLLAEPTARAARNVEFKARLSDIEAARKIARSLATQDLGEVRQRDTYFCVRQEQLELREAAGTAELIYYQRADAAQTRVSDYLLLDVPQVTLWRAALTEALGTLVVVEKIRHVLLWKNVRIHLDRVDALGEFLEFEAVVTPPVDTAAAEAQVAFLRERFAVAQGDLLAGSYADMLRNRM